MENNWRPSLNPIIENLVSFQRIKKISTGCLESEDRYLELKRKRRTLELEKGYKEYDDRIMENEITDCKEKRVLSTPSEGIGDKEIHSTKPEEQLQKMNETNLGNEEQAMNTTDDSSYRVLQKIKEV